MAESNIFPSPPDAVVVAPGKAYWIRFTDGNNAVVRLMSNMRAEQRTEMDGTKTSINVYDETEFEIVDKPGLEKLLVDNFGVLWTANYKGKTALVADNPIALTVSSKLKARPKEIAIVEGGGKGVEIPIQK